MSEGIKIRQLDENVKAVDDDVFVIDSVNPNFPSSSADLSYTRQISYLALKTQLEDDLEIPESGVSQIVAGTGITIDPVEGTGVVVINSDAVAGGVTKINAGAGISIDPNEGVGEVTINATSNTTAGVSKIIAGSNIYIAPNEGTGDVTINASVNAALDYDYITFPSKATDKIILTVTIGPRTPDNRYPGTTAPDGAPLDSQCFYINGEEAPFYIFPPGRTIRFEWDSAVQTYSGGVDIYASRVKGVFGSGIPETDKGPNYIEYTMINEYRQLYYQAVGNLNYFGNGFLNADGDEDVDVGGGGGSFPFQQEILTLQQAVQELQERL